jgi:hypothetical protein
MLKQMLGFKMLLQWSGYSKPSLEPLESLVCGPDTYNWLSKKGWLEFCQQGPQHIKPLLHSVAAVPAQPRRDPPARGRPARGKRKRSMVAASTSNMDMAHQPSQAENPRAPKRSRQQQHGSGRQLLSRVGTSQVCC